MDPAPLPSFDTLIHVSASDGRAYFDGGVVLETDYEAPATAPPRPWNDVARERGWPVEPSRTYSFSVASIFGDASPSLVQHEGPVGRPNAYLAGVLAVERIVHAAQAREEALRRNVAERVLVPPSPRIGAPTSSWLDVARAVGVDDSTIRTHRRRTRDGTAPLFADTDAARAWYAALVRAPDAPPPSGRRAPPKRTAPTGVVDWSKVDV